MFVSVRYYGTTSIEIKKKNILGEEICIPINEKIYFINSRFSLPNMGFLMTREGIVLDVTKESNMTPEEIRKHIHFAKDQITNNKIDGQYFIKL